MRARVVVLLVCVLALAAGSATWWVVARDTGQHEGTTAPEPEPTEPSSPTATPRTPRPEPTEEPGRPVAACAPDPAGRTPPTFWGMHAVEPIGSGFPDAPVTAVNLTTSQVYWSNVETAPGQYDFSRLDAIVATSEERGAQPMVVLGFTPTFHAAQPTSAEARTTMPDPTAWSRWVTEVVDRYGTRLDYQVWPEPNIVSNWTGTPEEMARLTAVAGRIIHARAPRARVVAPAVALRLTSQQRWTDRFWATRVDGRRVGDYVDAVAVDPFPLEDGGPEDSLELICRIREIMAGHDTELPVWTNEINYGVAGGGPDSTASLYDDERQVAVVARTYLLHAALGVDRVYWLGWFTYPGLGVGMARDDGSATAAGEAFRTVHGWMAGGSRPRCRVAAGVHTCLIDRGATELAVHWRTRGTSSVPAGAGARRIETLDGGGRPAADGDRIQVGQAPVAVVRRAGD